MKKLLFSAVSLDIGGIENALVNLLNYLARTDKYEITLFLEKKEGIFLDKIDKKIQISVLGQDRFSWTQLAAIVLICASVYLVEVAESNKQITSKLK